jgi:positive regulator of sigma E activity
MIQNLFDAKGFSRVYPIDNIAFKYFYIKIYSSRNRARSAFQKSLLSCTSQPASRARFCGKMLGTI